MDTEVSGTVNSEYRSLILPNHTMTHVLNLALRAVLKKAGQSEVDQKGSCVIQKNCVLTLIVKNQ